jgi:hypothetical protein
MTNRILITLAALGTIVCVGGPARADVVERTITGDGQSMRFQDDDLLGRDLSSMGDLVVIRPGPARVTLIRPRVSFVGELTKSVENF